VTSILERHRERFGENPADDQAFQALEEHHFLEGEWDELIGVYQKRQAALALEANPRGRAALMVREAHLWEERKADLIRAAECFERALVTDPAERGPLAHLRRIHHSQQRWDLVLQIAEVEAAHPTVSASERAALLADMGELWLDRLNDPEAALTQFQQSLSENPHQVGALAGVARSLEACGREREAAAAWEHATPRLEGSERTRARVRHAAILGGALEQPDRAIDLLRRALTEDPGSLIAIEALALQSAAVGLWSLFADLQQRRFEQTDDPERRVEIALEAGRAQLEHLHDLEQAQMWLSRCVDLAPEEGRAYQALADIARENGDTDLLLRSLERAIELSDGNPSVAALLEIASLHSERGDDLRALESLQLALELAPGDPLVGDALAETLATLGRDDELVDWLERRAEQAPDDLARAAMLAELGALHEERVPDPAAARNAYERAFAICPAAQGVATALERLYRKQESWDTLRRFLERAGQEAPKDERIGFLCSLAEILDSHFDDSTAAAHALNAALGIDPNAASAHCALQGLAETLGDTAAQRTAYEREASIATDPARLGFLLPKLARLCEAENDLEAALEWAKRRFDAEPDDTEALREWARLLDRAGREMEMIEALGQLDARVETREQSTIRRRIGALHVAAGRREEALRAYQAALEVDPNDVESLEILVVQLDIANQLEDLARTRRQLAELLPPPRRSDCLDALAHLLLDRLGDVRGAIAVLTRLAAAEGAPADVEQRLESLLERTGDYEALAERLRARREATDPDSVEAAGVSERLGRVLIEHLGRFEEAAPIFAEVRRRNPDSAVARDGLEAALRASGNTVGLADFLAEEMETAEDASSRDRLALKRASLLQDSSDRADEARETYRGLSSEAIDRDIRSEASHRLAVMLERSEDWNALREHLESRLGRGSEADDHALHKRLAILCAEHLDDTGGAAEHWEQVACHPSDRDEAWRVLSRLYTELGRDADLARILEAQLGDGPDPERELTLRCSAAALYAGSLSEPVSARAHYERVIELDPSHTKAAEFLLPIWLGEGRHGAVIARLETQLSAVGEPLGPDDDRAGKRARLRLQIAALRSGPADDVDGAIAALEPALGEVGPQAIVTEPLAGLYEKAGYRKDLLELCRKCIAVVTEPSERARWFLRSGEILHGQGKAREAVDSFTRALGEVPGRREAESALVELYRELDEPEPLAQRLEKELPHTTGSQQLSMRLELAALLADRLSRPLEGLEHLRRVLAVEPGHAEALDRAIALAEILGDDEATLEILEASLRQWQPPAARAGLLARRASLLAHVAGRPDEAIAAFREALSLDPGRPALRAELRAVLEAEGRWSDVLDGLVQDTRNVDGAARAAVLEHAVQIAWERISPDAALPWLERLRAVRPEDRTVVERIAHAHRIANRPELLLNALGDELRLSPAPERRFQAHLERARIFEETLGSMALAVSELEAAREVETGDDAVLRQLDSLYARLDRQRDRAEVLEVLLQAASDPERVSLLREVAALYSGSLKDPAAAVAHLLRAVAEAPPDTDMRRKLLADLGDALRVAGPPDAWVRCAEEELRSLDSSSNAWATRRVALHRELACVYERDLHRPAAALPYLRWLVDRAGPDAEEAVSDETETTLLRLLRAEGSWSELEARLATHVADHPDDDERWLELARLRDEKLQSPASAMSTYADLVERIPDCIPGLCGLRATATRVGDWAEVARSLELELDRSPTASQGERSCLLRDLGEVWWHRLDSTEKAAEFYSAALEAEPSDLQSLRALQNLAEEGAHWARALDLYEREAEMLNGDEAERLREVRLRAAELARAETGEPERALHAFSRAAELASLSTEHCWQMAQLQRDLGQMSEFAETFAAWCDDPGAETAASDHVALTETLISLDRIDDALARIHRGLELDPQCARAWELSAFLHQTKGDCQSAANALRRAAEVLADPDAAKKLLQAGELLEPSDPEQAAALLREAMNRDPANLSAQSSFARAALRTGNFEQAESAAGRGLDLANAGGTDDTDLRMDLALMGGRAALAQSRYAPAVRFFSAARALEPGRPEALAGLGDALAELGDLQAASRVFEPRLEQGDSYPDRARHLTIVGRSLEIAGDPDGAIERFEAALREDPGLAEAHEHLAGIHEDADRIEAGIAVLERWAEATTDPAMRAECWARAAQWELRAGDREQAVERHLREALEADAGCTRAAKMLALYLCETGRREEALTVLAGPLESTSDPAVHAQLALIQGRCLERLGDRAGAAAAFGSAATQSAEAALSGARLFKELGEWAAAAEPLRNFATHYDGNELGSLPEVLEGLGRLLAGPLEDLDGAIQVYRHAVSIAPERLETRALLADLLALRPENIGEALGHHRALLDADPTRAPSYRSVVRMARDRGNEEAATNGLAIQAALGIALPGPPDEKSGPLSLRLATREELADPLSEKLRLMAQAASHELAEALDGSEFSRPEAAANLDPALSFRSALLAAEGRLAAPALLPLTDREVGEVMSLLAALAVDPDQVRGDGQLVNTLASALGRRTRRRLRRILNQTPLEAIEAVDFSAWRREVHALATAQALDGIGGDLRTALVSLIPAASDRSPRDLPPGVDLTALIEGCPEADALLRLTLEAWLESV